MAMAKAKAMIWPLFVIADAIAVMLLLQFPMQKRACRSEGHATPDSADVTVLAAASKRKLYDFYAPHCGPCVAMTTLADHLRLTQQNLVTVDVASATALAREFGVVATPTFAQVEDGIIRSRHVGRVGERQLLRMLHAKRCKYLLDQTIQRQSKGSAERLHLPS